MKIRKFIYLILVPFLLLFESCEVLSFEELETNISIPANTAFYGQESVTLYFSCEMDRKKCEDLIQLKKSGSVIPVKFIWNGRNCIFSPEEGFIKGAEYSLNASGQALTADGRYYTMNITRSFIFGTESDIFFITGYEMPGSGDAGNAGALKIHFSKPADSPTFELNFSISPAVKTKKEYAPDMKSVTIIPEEKWDANVFYTWMLRNCYSKDGYLLNRSYTDSFRGNADSMQPAVTGIHPSKEICGNTSVFKERTLNEIYLDEQIAIIFSKEMDFQSVQNGISFSPSLSGFFVRQNGNTFVFHPQNKLKISQEYIMKISDSVRDLNGIPLYEPAYLKFKAANDFLKIDGMYINDINRIIPCKDIQSVKIQETDTIFLDLYFSTSIPPEKKTDVENGVFLENFFPADTSVPELVSIHWNSEGTCFTTRWNNITRSTEDESFFYRLKISGKASGIVNAESEYMEDDTWCVMKFL